ncbi:MAG TPA: hypothetical protein VGA20_06625 [Gemmatimonadales bacterium]
MIPSQKRTRAALGSDRHQRVVLDAAVRVIGEIVYDLDCKDDTFRRDEVVGNCRRICASRR